MTPTRPLEFTAQLPALFSHGLNRTLSRNLVVRISKHKTQASSVMKLTWWTTNTMLPLYVIYRIQTQGGAITISVT